MKNIKFSWKFIVIFALAITILLSLSKNKKVELDFGDNTKIKYESNLSGEEILYNTQDNNILDVNKSLQNTLKSLQDKKISENIVIKDKVLIAVDTSGSMDKQKLDDIKDSLYLFIDSLKGTGVQLSLVSFNSKIKYIIPFTSDLDKIRDGIDNLKSGGNTDILKSLTEISDYYSKDKTDFVSVVITDGGEGYDRNKRLSLLYTNDILHGQGFKKVYVVGYPEDIDSREYLLLIADIGRYFDSFELLNTSDILNIVRSELLSETYKIVNIECPVHVKIEHNGEILDSSLGEIFSEASFGTLIVNPKTKSKSFRLKDDSDYTLEIEAYDSGTVNMEFIVKDAEHPEYYKIDRTGYDLLISKGEKVELSVNNPKLNGEYSLLGGYQPVSYYVWIATIGLATIGISLCVYKHDILKALLLLVSIPVMMQLLYQNKLYNSDMFYMDISNVWWHHHLFYIAMMVLSMVVLKLLSKYINKKILCTLLIILTFEILYKYTIFGPVYTLNNIMSGYRHQNLEKVLEMTSVSHLCKKDVYEAISADTKGFYFITGINYLTADDLYDVVFNVKKIAEESYEDDRFYLRETHSDLDAPAELKVFGYNLGWIKGAVKISTFTDGEFVNYILVLEQIEDKTAHWRLAYTERK